MDLSLILFQVLPRIVSDYGNLHQLPPHFCGISFGYPAGIPTNLLPDILQRLLPDSLFFFVFSMNSSRGSFRKASRECSRFSILTLFSWNTLRGCSQNSSENSFRNSTLNYRNISGSLAGIRLELSKSILAGFKKFFPEIFLVSSENVQRIFLNLSWGFF